MGYNPNILHFCVGYNPFTNHLLTSWDILVDLPTKKESAIGPSENKKEGSGCVHIAGVWDGSPNHQFNLRSHDS